MITIKRTKSNIWYSASRKLADDQAKASAALSIFDAAYFSGLSATRRVTRSNVYGDPSLLVLSELRDNARQRLTAVTKQALAHDKKRPKQ